MNVFDKISEIICEISEVEPTDIKPTSNLIEDLYVDSLDFIEITYEIDWIYKIRLPVEEWMAEVAAGEAALDEYFVMERLVENVERLVAAANPQ